MTEKTVKNSALEHIAVASTIQKQTPEMGFKVVMAKPPQKRLLGREDANAPPE
ncbi:hypothetical protein A2U01_0099472 [Trifolium medium]|nr:hypothetical protein [Trifolium medium]